MADVVNVDLIEDDPGDATFQITSGGSALDLTSVTVTAVVKASEQVEDDDDGAHQLTADDGVTIVDAPTGKVKLTFPDAVTSAPSVWFFKIKADSVTAIIGWVTVQDA